LLDPLIEGSVVYDQKYFIVSPILVHIVNADASSDFLQTTCNNLKKLQAIVSVADVVQGLLKFMALCFSRDHMNCDVQRYFWRTMWRIQTWRVWNSREGGTRV